MLIGRPRWAGVLAASILTAARRARPRRRPATRICRPISLSGAGVEMLKLAVPRAEGDSGAAAGETMSKDMDITGLFQLLDPASFPAQLQTEGLAFSSALWTQVGAQAVIKMKVVGRRARGHASSSSRAATAPMLAKSYRAADIRDAVHEFANDVVKSFTGQPRRLRLAHRARDDRPRLARDRRPSTWTAGARRC